MVVDKSLLGKIIIILTGIIAFLIPTQKSLLINLVIGCGLSMVLLFGIYLIIDVMKEKQND